MNTLHRDFVSKNHRLEPSTTKMKFNISRKGNAKEK
jgi:hypothetical protein